MDDPGWLGPPIDARSYFDAETAWRLCTRGLEPGDAMRRAELEGDRRLAESVCRIVSIVH